jgi:hypothetical protein
MEDHHDQRISLAAVAGNCEKAGFLHWMRLLSLLLPCRRMNAFPFRHFTGQGLPSEEHARILVAFSTHS